MKPLDPIKEQRIIRAVFSIAGRQGLAGISMAGISQEAGVAVGSLYTYFDNKEDVIQAAYSRIRQELAEQLYADFDPKRPVREAFRLIYEHNLQYRLANYDETIFIDQYIQSPYLQIHFSKQLREFQAQNKPLYALLKKGQRAGQIRKTDPFILISFINGAIRSASNSIKQKLIPTGKKTIDICVNLAWNGIAN